MTKIAILADIHANLPTLEVRCCVRWSNPESGGSLSHSPGQRVHPGRSEHDFPLRRTPGLGQPNRIGDYGTTW